ncbi:hypothetical protein [Pyrobaculum aerophilum]|uniref:Uncharacterized protein n=1 Tax=Pyrobaculum aerophilum TaxID=13773 RepID=A0A832SXL9_9CREN|nr:MULTISPECIES: hypothetical protein [Pyrobaculum]HII46172.1 hypothetical protein [Pyrobaculum aerophilum]
MTSIVRISRSPGPAYVLTRRRGDNHKASQCVNSAVRRSSGQGASRDRD